MTNAAPSAPGRSGLFIPLAPLEEIPEGSARVFVVSELLAPPGALDHLEELRIAVARTGNFVYAIEDRCSHDNGPLGKGPVVGHQITCTRHGASFDLRTGKATRMPAISPVMVFPTRINAGIVEVDLSQA